MVIIRFAWFIYTSFCMYFSSEIRQFLFQVIKRQDIKRKEYIHTLIKKRWFVDKIKVI